MTFKDYQCAADATAATVTGERALFMGALGLAGEAGEVADALKKAVFHEHGVDRDMIVKELGDALWYIAFLSSALGSSLEEVAAKNVEKLRKRYPDGFSYERSINRVPDR